jgi:hypothetical protein
LTFLGEDVPVKGSEIILESLRTELNKLRRMAEQIDSGVLTYLIDLAILEMNSASYSVVEDKSLQASDDPVHCTSLAKLGSFLNAQNLGHELEHPLPQVGPLNAQKVPNEAKSLLGRRPRGLAR